MGDAIIIGFIGYALGSIPFGILLAKAFGLPDPRTIGSGNIGATNMLRTGRKDIALATLLLDAGKGVAAVLLAVQMNAGPELQALAALMAAMGHMFSPWLQFKGGKGVATILGGVLALSAIIGTGFCAIWICVFIVTRYVSLASIVALAIIPLGAVLQLGLAPAFILATATTIAIMKHRGNIERLLQGTEPKMTRKGADAH